MGHHPRKAANDISGTHTWDPFSMAHLFGSYFMVFLFKICVFIALVLNLRTERLRWLLPQKLRKGHPGIQHRFTSTLICLSKLMSWSVL